MIMRGAITTRYRRCNESFTLFTIQSPSPSRLPAVSLKLLATALLSAFGTLKSASVESPRGYISQSLYLSLIAHHPHHHHYPLPSHPLISPHPVNLSPIYREYAFNIPRPHPGEPRYAHFHPISRQKLLLSHLNVVCPFPRALPRLYEMLRHQRLFIRNLGPISSTPVPPSATVVPFSEHPVRRCTE